MVNIQDKYQFLCETPSDIYQHLPTIKKYAEQCEFIIEMGVRGIVSTWALLAGHPKQMLSVDIAHPKEFGADIMEVYDLADLEGTAYNFTQQSSLDITIPDCDLLFIDTLHKYIQLIAELNRHADKVKKYIIMHDTNLEGPDGLEMKQAVNEFLDGHSEWEIKEYFDNCNGLTVLWRTA